jgi:hypothetical protein
MEKQKIINILEENQKYEAYTNEEYKALITSMLRDCESFEGIKRVEAFQRIQTQMNDICKRKDMELIISVVDLNFDNLDHPLTTVAAIAKGMIRKSMQSEDLTKEDIKKVIARV